MRRTDLSRRPPLLRWWLWLVLGMLAALALPASSQAAALIEARINGTPVRLVADRAANRVLLEAGAVRALFDLAGGSVYVGEGGAAQRVHARYRPGHDEAPPFRIERFGPGPVIAGFVTTYHVLFVGEQVCAELMTVGWARPFVDPAIRALAMLEALEPQSVDPCQKIPFTTYATTGWPLISGKIDHPTIETMKIAFDYRPQPDELAAPVFFREGGIEHLIEVAKAAGL
jgi:hypothetical protein